MVAIARPFSLLASLIVVAHGFHRRNNAGAEEPIPAVTEAAYRRVALMKNDAFMKRFMLHILDQEGKAVTSDEEFASFVPWFSGTKAVQCLAKLRQDLLQQPWVVSRSSSGSNASQTEPKTEVVADIEHDAAETPTSSSQVVAPELNGAKVASSSNVDFDKPNVVGYSANRSEGARRAKGAEATKATPAIHPDVRTAENVIAREHEQNVGEQDHQTVAFWERTADMLSKAKEVASNHRKNCGAVDCDLDQAKQISLIRRAAKKLKSRIGSVTRTKMNDHRRRRPKQAKTTSSSVANKTQASKELGKAEKQQAKSRKKSSKISKSKQSSSQKKSDNHSRKGSSSTNNTAGNSSNSGSSNSSGSGSSNKHASSRKTSSNKGHRSSGKHAKSAQEAPDEVLPAVDQEASPVDTDTAAEPEKKNASSHKHDSHQKSVKPHVEEGKPNPNKEASPVDTDAAAEPEKKNASSHKHDSHKKSVKPQAEEGKPNPNQASRLIDTWHSAAAKVSQVAHSATHGAAEIVSKAAHGASKIADMYTHGASEIAGKAAHEATEFAGKAAHGASKFAGKAAHSASQIAGAVLVAPKLATNATKGAAQIAGSPNNKSSVTGKGSSVLSRLANIFRLGQAASQERQLTDEAARRKPKSTPQQKANVANGNRNESSQKLIAAGSGEEADVWATTREIGTSDRDIEGNTEDLHLKHSTPSHSEKAKLKAGSSDGKEAKSERSAHIAAESTINNVDTTLPNALDLLEKPSQVVAKLNEQLGQFRAEMKSSASQNHKKVALLKAELDKTLAKQRENTTMMREQNQELTNEITQMLKVNELLRETAQKLHSRSVSLRQSLQDFRNNYTIAQEFVEKSLQDAIAHEDKLKVLRNLDAAEAESSRKNAHESALHKLGKGEVALLQLDNEGDQEFDAASYVDTLSNNLKKLEREQAASVDALRQRYDKAMSEEAERQAVLIKERKALDERKEQIRATQEKLTEAVKHLQSTSSALEKSIHGLKKFTKRLGQQ